MFHGHRPFFKNYFQTPKIRIGDGLFGISKTWKYSLIFVKTGVKVNLNSYIQNILTPVLKEAKKPLKEVPFIIFQ